MAKTYDCNSPIGKVRLYGNEKNLTTSNYEDEELVIFINQASQDIFLATSLLWESKASAEADNASKTAIHRIQQDNSSLAEYALKMAAHFRDKAGSEPCADVAEVGGTDFQKRQILIENKEDFWNGPPSEMWDVGQ
jgi:hypothetical protein